MYGNKNILEQNSLYIYNIIENNSNNSNEKEELNNDMKLVLNEL